MTDPATDEDIARRSIACLDLTDLSDTPTATAIDALCHRAATPGRTTAAVCVWPQFVSQSARFLKGRGVRVATVINFPHGGGDIERAVEDTREALKDGADEIDLVIPWRALLGGDEQAVTDMVGAVKDELPQGRVLKTILETGGLREPAAIALASRLAIAAGADFLKTSTGKIAVSATPAAARLLLDAIRASGKPVGFKASGGVRVLADARLYLELAEHVMGPGWAAPATFRFGASGLLDALGAALDGGEARNTSAY